MSVAISALLQVMFIILLGYLIRRLMRFNDSFWDELAKLTYFLLTPALLIYSLGNKPLMMCHGSVLPASWLSFFLPAVFYSSSGNAMCALLTQRLLRQYFKEACALIVLWRWPSSTTCLGSLASLPPLYRCQ